MVLQGAFQPPPHPPTPNHRSLRTPTFNFEKFVLVFISRSHLLVTATCLNFRLPVSYTPFSVFLRWPHRPVLSPHHRVCFECACQIPAEPLGLSVLSQTAGIPFSLPPSCSPSWVLPTLSASMHGPRGLHLLNVPSPLSGSDPLSLLHGPYLKSCVL